eukprot:TRINITY_DN3539_c0_g1_i2.p3 TRINITY_DN3539_c0_g1~~TRINITY_DN3539_c0_g1_i2.p3  ORF type:complete len:116 (-),score=12.98 TRINITY_DN3539_c0_g1_i2:114-461(-)
MSPVCLVVVVVYYSHLVLCVFAHFSNRFLTSLSVSCIRFTTVSITGLSSPLTCNPNTCVAALEPATQLLYIWTDDQHAVLEVQVSIGKVLQQMAVKQFGGTRRAVSMDLAFWLCT